MVSRDCAIGGLTVAVNGALKWSRSLTFSMSDMDIVDDDVVVDGRGRLETCREGGGRGPRGVSVVEGGGSRVGL